MEALSAAVQAAFDKMVAEGGRVFTPRPGIVQPAWTSTYSGVTTNCIGDPNREQLPHTIPCTGWISPMTGWRECACPCHDDGRPPHQEALDVVRQRVADAEARR